MAAILTPDLLLGFIPPRLKPRDRFELPAAVLLIGLVLNVGSNLVLIPRYGILGAAASSSILYAVTATI